MYERLDALDSDTTEARAASILHGLGFDKEMQVRVGGVFVLGAGVNVELEGGIKLVGTCCPLAR